MARKWVDDELAPREKHLNENATGFCKSKVFEAVFDLTPAAAQKAAAELERRQALFAGRPSQKRRASGTKKPKEPLTSSPSGKESRWDRFVASGARLSRASVGQPGSGKRR